MPKSYTSSSLPPLQTPILDPRFAYTLSSDLLKLLQKALRDTITAICNDRLLADSNGTLVHFITYSKHRWDATIQPSAGPVEFRVRITVLMELFEKALREAGLRDGSVSARTIKLFLWTHPLIKRCNEMGQKLKSHGSHVWIVGGQSVAVRRDVFVLDSDDEDDEDDDSEARAPVLHWELTEFTATITNDVIESNDDVAYVGQVWSYRPRVQDPQLGSMCCQKGGCSHLHYPSHSCASQLSSNKFCD